MAYEKLLMKYLGYFLIGLFGLLAILFIGFHGYYYLHAQSNAALFGGSAPELEASGHRFRDLNKNGRLDPYEDSRLSPQARTDDLLAQMMLEEKAGAMFITQIASSNAGELIERPTTSDLFSLVVPTNSALVGKKLMNHFNVVFVESPDKMVQWHNRLQSLASRTRLGIPITIASDPRHGFGQNPAASLPAEHFSLWPEPLGMAATRDPALVQRFGELAREEYRAVGIHLALHPMADLATEPRWARAAGTFGEDAKLAAQMTSAYVKGFQGDQLGPNSVATMVKHFSGGGPQAGGRDAHFPHGKDQVYPGEQFDYHLIPFIDGALPAGAAQIMPYYGIPVGQTDEDVGFAFNQQIISGLLRERYGFDGVICSDWGLLTDSRLFGMQIKEASAWGVEHLSVGERMVKLLAAGIDQFGGESNPEDLVALVNAGELTEARLDRSVRRLMLDKFRLGLFDEPFVDEQVALKTVGNQAAIAAGEAAQRRSLVLLKNGDRTPVLPLQPANDQPLKLYVENLAEDALLSYAKHGANAIELEVVDNPSEADLAIVRISAPYYPRDGLMESNFHSGDLDFKGDEKARLTTLLTSVPTIVSIYLDRAAVIPEIAEHSTALVADFGATDEVLLQLLHGEFAPSGKLPLELPRSMRAVEQQLEDVPYDSADPLFPFGFGLSW